VRVVRPEGGSDGEGYELRLHHGVLRYRVLLRDQCLHLRVNQDEVLTERPGLVPGLFRFSGA
jgi:hypothetical protein